MICEILQLGDPLLRTAASPVTDLHDPTIGSLITDLNDTLQSSQGVGIAAPQIGVSLQIVIIASQPNDRYPLAPLIKPTALINPIIEYYSDTIEKGWEGCLSVPGIRGLVPRSKQVRINYFDAITFERTYCTFDDFVARIVQHEIDHLNKLIFIDRIESSQELVTEQEYKKIIANQRHTVDATPTTAKPQV